MAEDTNYLHRMTCLFCINVMAEAVGSEIVVTLILPVVLNLSSDSVANIRFNVCKTIMHLTPMLDARYVALHSQVTVPV